jgi:hypothetical protein
LLSLKTADGRTDFFSFTSLHIKGYNRSREFTKVFAISLGLGVLGTLLPFSIVEGYVEFARNGLRLIGRS